MLIWSPGVYGTILTGMEKAVQVAGENGITLEQLEELRALARQTWEKCVYRNELERPANAEESARAAQLGIL